MCGSLFSDVFIYLGSNLVAFLLMVLARKRVRVSSMAEQQPQVQQHQLDSPPQTRQPSNEDMIACVNAMDAALLPCLPNYIQLTAPIPDFDGYEPILSEIKDPTLELQYVTDDCPLSLHQTEVEKHAKDFMEAAKQLQQYFFCLRRPEDKPRRAEILGKEIAAMEEELKIKDELIQKQEKLIQELKQELKDQFDQLNAELERV